MDFDKILNELFADIEKRYQNPDDKDDKNMSSAREMLKTIAFESVQALRLYHEQISQEQSPK